jgi:signal transduction histidine kinase
MKKFIFVLGVIFLLNAELAAQTAYVDSLVNILNTAQLSPSEQIKLLKRITHEIPHSHVDRKINFAKQGAVLSNNEDDKISESWFYNSIGGIYDAAASYDSSLMYFEKAMAIAKEKNNAERQMAYTLNIGNSYTRQGKYATALRHYMEIIPICEKNATSQRTRYIYSNILGNIAELYLEMNNLDRALYYIRQAERVEGIGTHQLSYVNGRICMERGEFEKALEYELKAINFLEEKYPQYRAYCSHVASTCYLELGDHDKALEYALDCLRCADIVNDPKLYVKSYNALSDVYLAQKRWKECETVALKAWAIDSADLDNGPNIARNIIIASINLGNKARAEHFLDKSGEIIKRYNNKSFHETLLEIEVKHKTEQQQIRIASLEKEQQLYDLLLVLVVALMLTTCGMLLYRHRLAVQKHKTDEQQMEKLEKEKQVVAMQSLLDGETIERKYMMHELHDRLGTLLSVINRNLLDMRDCNTTPDGHYLNATLKLMGNARSELHRIAHHLMPESLENYGLKTAIDDLCRSTSGVDFNYSGATSRLNRYIELLIYRCAYELVNNAIKYSGEKVHINVLLVVDKERITLSVYDDGKGFDPTAVTSGSGLAFLREKILAYNGRINIHSAPNEGSEIIVEIDLQS